MGGAQDQGIGLPGCLPVLYAAGMRTTQMLLFGLLCAATALAQPMPPTQPVEFTTDLGSAAAEGGKVVLKIRGVIDTAAGTVGMNVTIHQEQFMGVPADLPVEAAAPAARMLSEASDALLSGQEYSQEANGVVVAVAQGRTAKVVQVKLKNAGFMQTSSFDFDADNAASVARILERTPRIVEWLNEKLSAVKR